MRMSQAKRLPLKSRSINRRARATLPRVEDVSSESLPPQSYRGCLDRIACFVELEGSGRPRDLPSPCARTRGCLSSRNVSRGVSWIVSRSVSWNVSRTTLKTVARVSWNVSR
eukprot:8668442-Pyramimonas_sp.AAC.1